MIVFLFLFGLCVGSFLNSLVYRLNEGNLKSFIFGRSVCPKCKHKLEWRDNTPLFSFVLLGGRCRYCQKPISIHYPLVELATGILTVSIFFHGLFYLFITYALVAIFLSDLLYQTVPDEIVYPAIGVALFYSIINHQSSIISGFLAGLFFLILVLITKGQGMGMGDVKLAALMGLFLGYPKIIVALYMAFLTGAIAGVILILLGKKRFGEHIPFGPFLIGSTFVSLFWGEIIWNQGTALLLLNF